jgi:hypothetical protein
VCVYVRACVRAHTGMFYVNGNSIGKCVYYNMSALYSCDVLYRGGFLDRHMILVVGHAGGGCWVGAMSVEQRYTDLCSCTIDCSAVSVSLNNTEIAEQR